MQRFAIAAEVCADLPTAAKLINTRKFEAIVVDLGLGEQSMQVLEHVRLSPSNQSSVTFAVVDYEAAARREISAQLLPGETIDGDSDRKRFKGCSGPDYPRLPTIFSLFADGSCPDPAGEYGRNTL